ncbi:flagellar hook-associated protein FlgK [Roseibium denhamense]|uniref:Flagellar hook-associated protein 1 n=1 Tax=Roseibium denhamense TaxID=76305 RepID=A0ABY1N8B0_9HYPH|nr:flagellar hook-associated protein FlgK [Roseibium denhamense]MTI05604.1 flagellar hook-associated protein FlgK [Roseibium denhamense]SMP03153.1 flagellar hook-associated protein 1 FlgK [Roseibium denhamense]
MGLTSALNTAVFGITYNQRQMDVTAANIANADTAGYSTKTVSAKAYFDGQGNVAGVVSNEIRRVLDTQIQEDYFASLSDTNYANQVANFTDRLDDIFGTIGDDSGLASMASKMTAALSGLVNNPGNYAAQLDVVSTAEAFAREINSSYERIYDLRREADDLLGQQAETVNGLLQEVSDIDDAIREATISGVSTAEMEDQRDRIVEQLSGYLDIETSIESDDNTLTIRTSKGVELYANNQASTVSFDATHAFAAGETGNSVIATTPGGTSFDLLDATDSGSMLALQEIRDEVLVEAQQQLDTIAAELSLAFSNVTVESTAVTVGLDDGFDLDVSALQPGNSITLEYTDTGGNPQTVTLVAVDDPTLLPLDNTATARTDDTVLGFDISSGLPATYITNITAALAGTGLLVSNDGADNLRVLGDNTAPTTVESLSAEITPTGSSDQGLGLPIFVDSRNGTEVFSDALEDGGQRVGYAMGITVNPALLADSALLVNYETTPTANSSNDPARPEYLLNAFTSGTSHFDPSSGIGSASTPFEGSVIDYINQTVAFQGNQAADAKTYFEAKETLTLNLAVRYEESYSVDLDAELAFLVQLENAYAANARVMQTINDLFDRLLNIV